LSLGTASLSRGLPGVGAPFEWRQAGELVWLEAALGSATAAFSTRLGGVSEGPYSSLNLGVLTADDQGRVLENRELLARELHRDAASIVMGRQVHGTNAQLRETAPAEGSPPPEADAQITPAAHLTPLVLVADCVPLVIAASGPRNPLVAAVHCGWRGIAGGIVETVLGTTGPQVRAAIGPGIGACCYEVGDEVRAAFRARGHVDEVMRDGRLDLARAIRAELERLGLAPGQVHECGLCTACNPELFFSHRRDRGRTGRQAGLGWLSS
jgi:YfiH family protein